jgi:hypothetical protein
MTTMTNDKSHSRYFMSYAELFGLLLEAHWIKLGIPQTRIAVEIKMDQSYLSKKKLAKHSFTMGELFRMSRVLGVSCATLFDRMDSLCARLYQREMLIRDWNPLEMKEANNSTQLVTSIIAEPHPKNKPISVSFVACSIVAASQNTKTNVWTELNISEASWKHKHYGEDSLFLSDLILFECWVGVSLSSLFQRLDEVCLNLSSNGFPVQGWIYTKDKDQTGDDQRLSQILTSLLPSRGWIGGPLHPRDLGFGFPHTKTEKWSAINGK